MKLLSPTTVALATATLLVAACAGSEPTTETDVKPTEPASAPAQPLPPSQPSKPPAKVCMTGCTADSDCASTCPDKAGTIACCDRQTGTCYSSALSTCPAPVSEDDAGSPSY